LFAVHYKLCQDTFPVANELFFFSPSRQITHYMTMPVFLTRLGNRLVITIQQEISRTLAGSFAGHVATHLGEGEAKLASPPDRNGGTAN